MENRKRTIMVVLSVVVCIMAIGYALLAQQLTINGTASIDSKWRIQITNITEKDIVGEAYSKVTPSYTAITANFNVGLIKPGDSIAYDVEVSNLGTLKAKVNSINIATSDDDGIIYTVSGIEEGDKLAPSEKDILTIKVEYDKNATSIPEVTTKNITIIMNYVQDIDGVDVVDPMPDEPEVPVSYDYVVGDVISFAGSNWRVIKDSSSDEDYVTLLKETILTKEELGDYAINIKCNESYVTTSSYGCTTQGQVITLDAMPYYWSDTCHGYGYYGYTNGDGSGCTGHNDYEGSKVREFLEGTYINTLGTNNLKEVDDYKIRLITTDELVTNLGFEFKIKDTQTSIWYTDATPKWFFSEEYFDPNTSWTMTPNTYQTMNYKVGSVWTVSHIDTLVNGLDDPVLLANCVRPVINLLKTSI